MREEIEQILLPALELETNAPVDQQLTDTVVVEELVQTLRRLAQLVEIKKSFLGYVTRCSCCSKPVRFRSRLHTGLQGLWPVPRTENEHFSREDYVTLVCSGCGRCEYKYCHDCCAGATVPECRNQE